MRKFSFALMNALTLCGLCGSVLADTLLLNDGEKIEGKITHETKEELTVEIKISSSINDTRTIQKRDLLIITKDEADDIAWKPFQAFKLAPNSLAKDSYANILGSLKKFMAQFPASSHVAEARHLVKDVEEEQERVEAGEIKLRGKWLRKEDVERERYQISGNYLFDVMQEQSTRGDLIGALNTFDSLEKQYLGARIYPDAVELSLRLLAALKADLDRRQQILKVETAEQQRGLQMVSLRHRTEMIIAIQRDIAVNDAALAAAEKRSQKWPPLIARSDKSLSALSAKIAPEAQRLSALEVDKFRQSIQLMETAGGMISKKQLDEAEKIITKAETLWRANEMVVRMKNELTEAKKLPVAEKVEVSKPATTPGTPAVPKGTGLKGSAPRFADIQPLNRQAAELSYNR